MNSKIPDIFKNYENKKKMPGQNGTIKIEIQASDDSKTYIKSLLSKAPFLIQKAMYPDSTHPYFAHIYIMSSSGGILQGDEQSIDVVMGKNSTARITTQSATKIYKMDRGYASQYINIYCQNRSYLEFIPHQIIPFKSSRFYQEVNLEVEENAILIYSEIISSGRIASGEKFDFDLCFLRTTGYKNDQVLFTDVMNLSHKDKENSEFIFGGKNIFSTIYIIGNSVSTEQIVDTISQASENTSLLASCSTLPHNSGIIVRILGDSVPEIMNLTEAIAGIFRETLEKNRKAEPEIQISSQNI